MQTQVTPESQWIVQLSKPGELEQLSFPNEQEAREYAALQSVDVDAEVTLRVLSPAGHAEVIPHETKIAITAAGA